MAIRLVHPDYTSEKLIEVVTNILNSTEIFSMATANRKGTNHIYAAYFCFNDDLDLYSVSDISTTHAKNIADVPEVAVSVFDSHQPWESSHRGLQLFGKCRQASLLESARALKYHSQRFHAYAEYISALNPFDRERSPYKFFIFQPDRIKLFDETEFGEETFVLAELQRS